MTKTLSFSKKEVEERLKGSSLVRSFVTAKGSAYFMGDKKETLRFKSYHKEHGVSDQGWKDLSNHTIYTSEFNAILIASYIHGRGWLLLKNSSENKKELHLVSTTGKLQTLEVIPFETSPKVGLSPVELFDLEEVVEGIYKPTIIHPGNPIVHIINY